MTRPDDQTFPDETFPEDERLTACLDDALSPTEMAELEAALADDEALRRRLRRLAATDELVRRAFDAPMREPVPERLSRVLGGVAGVPRAAPAPADDIAASGAGAARDGRVVQLRRRVAPIALPLAASLALLIGLGAGIGLSRFAADAPTAIAWYEGAPLDRTLEATASGVMVSEEAVDGRGLTLMPLASFFDEAGRACREFEAEGEPGAVRGVACRDDGGWRPSLIAHLGAPDPDAAFRPAAATADGFARALEAMTVGTPLTRDEEAAAIAAGWQATDRRDD